MTGEEAHVATGRCSRIALIDERQFVRAGIGLLLSRYDDIEVVRAVASVAELLESPDAQRLDGLMVVLGVVTDGDAVVQRLRASDPGPAALIAVNDPAVTCDVRVDPAADFMQLLAAIRRVATAGVPPQRPMERHDATTAVHLTSRQLAVLHEICRGRSTAEISRVLDVTPKTVEHHKQQIFVRLGVHSRAEAVTEAFRLCVLPLAEVSGPHQ